MTEGHDDASADPQEQLLAFLSDGRSYGVPGAEVERITTHAAHVFLVGDRADKMKGAGTRQVPRFHHARSAPTRARDRARAEPADRADAVSAPRAANRRRWRSAVAGRVRGAALT